MVKIQLELPEELNDNIKHFMIDNKIEDKRIAIIKIINTYFNRGINENKTES